MTRKVSMFAAGAAGVLTLGVAGDAHALPGLAFSASLRGLVGAPLGTQPVNPYDFGVGLRAGLTLPMSLYLGASFDYFAGETLPVLSTEASASIYQLMANVGYDFALWPVTLRPSLGLGWARSNLDFEDDTANLTLEDSASSDFVLSPGVEVLVGLGLLSLSGELRYNKVFADDDRDAVVFGVGLGISL